MWLHSWYRHRPSGTATFRSSHCFPTRPRHRVGRPECTDWSVVDATGFKQKLSRRDITGGLEYDRDRFLFVTISVVTDTNVVTDVQPVVDSVKLQCIAAIQSTGDKRRLIVGNRLAGAVARAAEVGSAPKPNRLIL